MKKYYLWIPTALVHVEVTREALNKLAFEMDSTSRLHQTDMIGEECFFYLVVTGCIVNERSSDQFELVLD